MEYYDENYKKIDISDEVFKNVINHGVCGTAYRYDEVTCLKCYDRGFTNTAFIMNKTLYDDLKTINSNNVIQIKGLLYKKENKEHFTANAYLSTYYHEKYKKLLEVPSEYLLENMEGILKLSDKISDIGYRFKDLKRENIILTDKHIVICDNDGWFNSYQMEKLSKYQIRSLNINAITYIFAKIARDELKGDHLNFLVKNNLYFSSIENKLFPLTCNKDRAMKTLTKRLTGYKRPIDYFYSMKK